MTFTTNELKTIELALANAGDLFEKWAADADCESREHWAIKAKEVRQQQDKVREGIRRG